MKTATHDLSSVSMWNCFRVPALAQVNSTNMASLRTSPLTCHSVGALPRPSAGIHAPSLICITPGRYNMKAHLDLRSSRKEVRVQAKERWSPVLASNSNPSSDGSDDTKTDAAAAGPPFLTVLAGVLVFLFICWIIGSVVTWFIGLILHPPPLK